MRFACCLIACFLLAASAVLSQPTITEDQAVELTMRSAFDSLRISNQNRSGPVRYDAFDPAVAYSSVQDLYLVVWSGHVTPRDINDHKREIFGQALRGSDGYPRGVPFRISSTGAILDSLWDARSPAVSYSPNCDCFLVVWQGTNWIESGDEETEIFGQFLEEYRWFRGDGSFRISMAGAERDPTQDAQDPDVVYNPNRQEFLVVWQADDAQDGEFEIFGQHISEDQFEPTGDPFQISKMGPDGNRDYDARWPSVSYNTVQEEYAIVYTGNSPGDVGPEIYFQRFSETGAATQPLRISGPGTDAGYSTIAPAIVHNHLRHEYLATWSATVAIGSGNAEFEVFGQRLDAASGTEIGENNFRISYVGPELDVNFDALSPRLVYHPVIDEYLVTWQGSFDNGVTPKGEFEIFCQRLSGIGTPLGEENFRISTIGEDGESNPRALTPAVTVNARTEEYMVVWSGIENPEIGFEIYQQRLDRRGAEIGSDDAPARFLRFFFSASSPALAYNWRDNEYLIVWEGNPPGTTLMGAELEIYGQRIDATTGEFVGEPNFQISHMGPDYDYDYDARRPDVVFNERDHEYLVVWSGEDKHRHAEEIFAQRIDANTGLEVGANDFAVSAELADPSAGSIADWPSVAYGLFTNSYLIAWDGYLRTGSLFSREEEISARRIDSFGGFIDADPIRISDMGPDGDRDFRASYPVVTYIFTGPADVVQKDQVSDGTFAIAWTGSDLAEDANQVFIELIDEVTGETIGDNDIRISDMGPGTDPDYYARYPSIVSDGERFLVVWEGSDDTVPLVAGEREIFGQFVDFTGQQIGPDDFRISVMGPDGDDDYDAEDPDVLFDFESRTYLIVWSGSPGEGPLARYENEIFLQRFGLTTGFQLGTEERISITGEDGDATRDSYRPRLAGQGRDDEASQLVVWESDHVADYVWEIFGTFLDRERVNTDLEARDLPASGFSLSGPYPNPAVRAAFVGLATEDITGVRISLVDELGRMVSTLFEGTMLPGAEVSVSVPTEDLAPGVYLIVVEGGEFRESRQLIVVR